MPGIIVGATAREAGSSKGYKNLRARISRSIPDAQILAALEADGGHAGRAYCTLQEAGFAPPPSPFESSQGDEGDEGGEVVQPPSEQQEQQEQQYPAAQDSCSIAASAGSVRSAESSVIVSDSEDGEVDGGVRGGRGSRLRHKSTVLMSESDDEADDAPGVGGGGGRGEGDGVRGAELLLRIEALEVEAREKDEALLAEKQRAEELTESLQRIE
jgi:hypothetical protein